MNKRNVQSSTSEPRWLIGCLLVEGAILACVISVIIEVLIICPITIGLNTRSDHGDSLMEYIQNTRDETYEYTGMFLLSGEKICEFTDYSPIEVDFPVKSPFFWYTLELIGHVDVHNHPSGNEDEEEDLTFSVIDLRSYVSLKPDAGLVVTSSCVYQIEAPNGWPSSKEFCEFLTEAKERVIQSNEWLICNEGWLEVSCYPEIWNEMLSKFDFAYKVTPIDEWTPELLGLELS